MLRKIITVAVTALVAATGASVATAAVAHRQTSDRVEFYKVTQDYPTNHIQRFIIKGEGCLRTEDATRLRLVSYDPAHYKVIYRCVAP